MFKTIVVAIHTAEHSHAVLSHTADLAARFGAEVHVVTVRDLAQNWPLTLADPVPEVFKSLDDDLQPVLEDARRQLQERGVRCQTHALEGPAARQISRLAEKLGAELIIIGHRHLSRFRRMLAERVDRDLSDEPPCTVMVVVQPSAK